MFFFWLLDMSHAWVIAYLDPSTLSDKSNNHTSCMMSNLMSNVVSFYLVSWTFKVHNWLCHQKWALKSEVQVVSLTYKWNRVNSILTSFLAPNSYLWGKWNAPLSFAHTLYWSIDTCHLPISLVTAIVSLLDVHRVMSNTKLHESIRWGERMPFNLLPPLLFSLQPEQHASTSELPWHWRCPSSSLSVRWTSAHGPQSSEPCANWSAY